MQRNYNNKKTYVHRGSRVHSRSLEIVGKMCHSIVCSIIRAIYKHIYNLT